MNPKGPTSGLRRISINFCGCLPVIFPAMLGKCVTKDEGNFSGELGFGEIIHKLDWFLIIGFRWWPPQAVMKMSVSATSLSSASLLETVQMHLGSYRVQRKIAGHAEGIKYSSWSYQLNLPGSFFLIKLEAYVSRRHRSWRQSSSKTMYWMTEHCLNNNRNSKQRHENNSESPHPLEE